MLLKNATQNDTNVRINNVETTIKPGMVFTVEQSKGEELLNNYPNIFSQLHIINPNILLKSGEGSPSTAPATGDLFYFDTTNKALYVATGTSASTDWKQLAFAE